LAPVIAAANGNPQALAWNSGTIKRMVSHELMPNVSLEVSDHVWSTVER